MQILVPEHMAESSTAYDLVWATNEFIEAAIEMFYRPDELPRNALRAYDVDQYLQHVNQGGHAHFVLVCGWDREIVDRVRDGLEAMGADAHRVLFERLDEHLGTCPDDLASGLDEGGFTGDLAAALEGFDEQLHEVEETESLIDINRRFLESCDDLRVLPPGQFEAEMAALAEAVPDLDARVAEAQAMVDNDPARLLVARLCEEAGQQLESINATDEDVWQGERCMRIHISTDRGYHVVVVVPGTALLVVGDTTDVLAEAELEQPE